ncbi:putative glucan endo-1,3-beta-glucosidase btgC [Aspergillus novoparasiticus]|uniref:glucan endo-1,3-beta-D-glucosidase n=1 Tax=Aspergillus novoparasiticus TaxID=986946 RepID=A0A5N6E8Z2_9EURO|nr:putative glucan endo-1,3-beta-glucosidase btgC [Aspergillus novoparasiticus]
MSGPHRSFSFNQGDDGAGDAGDVSPIRSQEGHFMNSPPRHNDVSPVSARSQAMGSSPSSGFLSAHEHGDRDWGQNSGHTQAMRTNSTTPGMDNLGPAAVGGGISGIALGVANSHNRQSGIDAFRDTDGRNLPAERGYNTTGSDNPYVPTPPGGGSYGSAENLRPRDSYGSNVALGAAAAPAGQLTPGGSNPSQRSLFDSPYQGVGAMDAGPYQRQSAYSAAGDYPLVINPDEIADDGDDGFTPAPNGKSASHNARAIPAAAAGGAAGGGLFGLFKSKKADNPSYGPVPGAGLEAGEKSRWVKPTPGGGSRKRGWIVGLALAFIVVGAIVGGAVGGTLGNRENEAPDTTKSASSDTESNGDLNKDSSEIKDLMNNPDLHKVFPGMDYTPWGVQYPLCLKYPPSQNNVTRDVAVLSQLTNTVRLYGTDCNQTEMVLHAIDRLELKDMKVWLGVWIDSNDTTNDRQIKQLYKVLDDTKDISIFKGAIVGNEALYRAGNDIASAKKKLISYMDDVRNHFKEKNYDLPIATSDLGDNWKEDLVTATDLVMSNVHPFFAGVTAKDAASWTWNFWNQNDVPLTKGTNKKQVISEVGWPSGGGNDCGSNNKCTDDTSGSVAGIDEMNQFMSDWICQALENGTDYFWFEAFDEPWKVQYNTKDENWEDKWGLMDAARKLKPGLKIPDCGGKTAA